MTTSSVDIRALLHRLRDVHLGGGAVVDRSADDRAIIMRATIADAGIFCFARAHSIRAIGVCRHLGRSHFLPRSTKGFVYVLVVVALLSGRLKVGWGGGDAGFVDDSVDDSRGDNVWLQLLPHSQPIPRTQVQIPIAPTHS